MKNKTSLVREACAAHPGLPTKTLARQLYRRHRALWPSLDACYSALRYARGNCGEQHRRDTVRTHFRPNQPAGFKWVFPKSSAKKWEPFVLDQPRTLVLSDLHIPFHDSAAIHAVVRHAHRWNPAAVLINGDLCDFHSLSRFDKNPTASSLLREIMLTRQFLGWLRQEFPRARLIYKFGNHDEWFDRYLWRKAPELWNLPQLSLANILTQRVSAQPAHDGFPAIPASPEIDGIEFVTDQRKITAGHLDILHGHELGKGSIAPPVNPARGFFLKTLECTLAGHLHRTSVHAERTSKNKQVACWSTGCLCGLWPDYAKINKWDHSTARVDLSGMDFNVTPIRVIDGKIV